MDQAENSSRSPMQLVAVIGGAVMALLLVALLRSRRETSKIDKAFTPIVSSIQESALPDRAKSMLLESVDQVRQVLHSVKDFTDEVAADA